MPLFPLTPRSTSIQLGYESDKCFRFVRVKPIAYECPSSIRINVDRFPYHPDKISFLTRVVQKGRIQLPCHSAPQYSKTYLLCCTRTPLCLPRSAGSSASGLPGIAGKVSWIRCSACIPVFSSTLTTWRPSFSIFAAFMYVYLLDAFFEGFRSILLVLAKKPSIHFPRLQIRLMKIAPHRLRRDVGNYSVFDCCTAARTSTCWPPYSLVARSLGYPQYLPVSCEVCPNGADHAGSRILQPSTSSGHWLQSTQGEAVHTGSR